MFNQKEYIKDWRIKNRDRMLKCMRDYKEKNKDKLRIKAKEYYQNNKYRIKKYQSDNKDNIKQYEQTHKKQRRNWLKKYLKRPEVKISYNMRRRINLALNGKLQSGTIIELLGCNIETLKQHLELQFTEGMTFDNYGDWHIDHINPCVSFDLSREEEQKKCFHYTNLRPLWATDNLTRPRILDKRAGDLE